MSTEPASVPTPPPDEEGQDPVQARAAEDRAPSEQAGRILRLDGLSIAAGEKPLLRNADLTVRTGEVVLLVGPSGAGKSVLLRVLGGLIDETTPGFHLEGKGDVGGAALITPGASRRLKGHVGIVFQEFGLFDEMGPKGNLRFAWDHAVNKPGPRSERLPRLLDAFAIEADLPIRHCSPGQRQRIAVARTLAFNPDLVLFDEPTSGLDPASSKRVADRIRKTAAEFDKACVVVTHDYVFLGPIADRVFWLDPSRRRLEEVGREELAARAEAAAPAPVVKPGRRLPIKAGLLAFLALGAAIPEALFEFARFLLPLWRKPRWGLRFLAHYMWLVASPGAFLYLGAAGAITGFVATYFTFEYFPYRSYTEPLLLDDVLGSLGFLQFRILVPILATVLAAARCGAAIAADVGNRRWTGATEAIQSFGVDPRTYLYTGTLWACLAGIPVMTWVAFQLSRLFSLLAFVLHHPQQSPLFWYFHFHKFMGGASAMATGEGWPWLLAKVLTCSAVIALTAFRRGNAPQTSVVTVNRAVTSTVIRATMGVLLVHLFFAFYEF